MFINFFSEDLNFTFKLYIILGLSYTSFRYHNEVNQFEIMQYIYGIELRNYLLRYKSLIALQ